MDEAKTDVVAEATTLVVMTVKPSGQTPDRQFFQYKMNVLSDVTRVEWPLDTMVAELPATIAGYLLGRNYARAANPAEVEAYTAPAAEKPEEKPAPKKGAKS